MWIFVFSLVSKSMVPKIPMVYMVLVVSRVLGLLTRMMTLRSKNIFKGIEEAPRVYSIISSRFFCCGESLS